MSLEQVSPSGEGLARTVVGTGAHVNPIMLVEVLHCVLFRFGVEGWELDQLNIAIHQNIGEGTPTSIGGEESPFSFRLTRWLRFL